MNPHSRVRSLRLAALLLAYGVAAEAQVHQGLSAPPFSWWQAIDSRDLDGAKVPISERWVVLAFLDPECPVANACLPVLGSLSRSFQGKGVRVIGIYTDPAWETERLRQHAREFSIEFRVLRDRDQRLVQFTAATYSSEVAVLDGSGAVLYRGRIDNRVGENGVSRPKATQHDLNEVLERLCAGEVGPFPSQPGFGCFLPNPSRQP